MLWCQGAKSIRLHNCIPGILKSRDHSRSRDVSRPIFDGLGLGLEGLEGSGLVNIHAVYLNPRLRAPYDHNVRPSQTDERTNRQMDEHRGYSATTRSNERHAR